MQPAVQQRLHLRALTPSELKAHFVELGEPAYRGEQVFRWLHAPGLRRVDQMSNLPADLRARLSDEMPGTALTLDQVASSADGTRKLRFLTTDHGAIESVLIPDDKEERDKLTLCISSQVGCALDCQFCATARLGFRRNLSAAEIVEQVYAAVDLAGRRPTNLVFMGMGEPLHNFEQLERALGLLEHPWGVAFSPRRITVSTSGLVPGIERLGQLQPPPHLAISLNATTDEVRNRLMPINRRWPIPTLLDAVRRFPLTHGRRVTFEYVMLAGVNDSDEDAHRLPRLLRGIPCKVNLIPWNPWPDEDGRPRFERPIAERIRTFQELLRAGGLPVYIRTPRGDDIAAACGQLAAQAGAATAGAGPSSSAATASHEAGRD